MASDTPKDIHQQNDLWNTSLQWLHPGPINYSICFCFIRVMYGYICCTCTYMYMYRVGAFYLPTRDVLLYDNSWRHMLSDVTWRCTGVSWSVTFVLVSDDTSTCFCLWWLVTSYTVCVQCWTTEPCLEAASPSQAGSPSEWCLTTRTAAGVTPLLTASSSREVSRQRCAADAVPYALSNGGGGVTFCSACSVNTLWSMPEFLSPSWSASRVLLGC